MVVFPNLHNRMVLVIAECFLPLKLLKDRHFFSVMWSRVFGRWTSYLKFSTNRSQVLKKSAQISLSTQAVVFLSDESEKTLPKEPIAIPSSNFSHEFLIRQSSVLSEEAASRYLDRIKNVFQN